MENEIFKLRKEHVNFKKLLSLFDAQLDFLYRGKSPDYQLMEDILYYMTQYTDLIHHPIEEVIFSLLAARDTSVVENVAALTKQHQMIGDSGAFLYKKIGNIINGNSGISKLQEIEMLGRLYSSTLRIHMDKSKPDPIFGEAIEARFHLVCDKLARSASNK
jgi:hemerythrin-like domain-containing protein